MGAYRDGRITECEGCLQRKEPSPRAPMQKKTKKAIVAGSLCTAVCLLLATVIGVAGVLDAHGHNVAAPAVCVGGFILVICLATIAGWWCLEDDE